MPFKTSLGVGRDLEDAENPTVEQRLLRHIESRGANGNRYRLVGIERLDQTAAQHGAIIVHYGDRDLADELAEIGLQIEHAIKNRSNE